MWVAVVSLVVFSSARADEKESQARTSTPLETVAYVRKGVFVPEATGSMRFRSVPSEAWSRILQHLSRYPGAVVEESADLLLVDESKIGSDGVQQRLGRPGDGLAAEVGGAKAQALCVRTPVWPGWVNWAMSYPSAYGFSVKPESVWPLTWAYAPGQDCDGVYNRSWGCSWSVKVPDSCTATIDSYGNISCCCNAALAQLGYVCQWVNPGAIGWPACPL